MSKPKIYATCKAGCLWETVHKSDFEKSACAIALVPNEDGLFILEKGKTYKIKKVSKTGYGFSLYIREREVGSSSTSYGTQITLPAEVDKYEDYFKVRLLDTYETGTYPNNSRYALIEFEGVAREEIMTYTGIPAGTQFEEPVIVVRNATECLWYNADATMAAEKVYVRYSANADGTDFKEIWSEGQNYIGIATGIEPPVSKNAFTWTRIADIVNVVQGLGYSETDAVSQKTVTEEIKKITDYEYAPALNKFTPDNIIAGKYVDANGIIQDNEPNSSLAFAPITPYEEYTIHDSKTKMSTALGALCYVDENFNIVQSIPASTVTNNLRKTENGYVVHITNDPAIKYVCITYHFRNDERTYLMIEEGTTEHPYEKPPIKKIAGHSIVTDAISESRWYDKKGLFHGDSITEGNPIGEDTVYTTYPNLVAKKLCLKEHINLAHSGWRVAGNISVTNALCNNVDEILQYTDIDFIYIAIGVNDFFAGTPLGDIGSFNGSTFYGAFDQVITKLLTAFPNIPIILATPIRNDMAENSLGLKLTDYREAILNVCDKYGILCNDMYHRFGYDPNNASVKAAMFYPDGTHPYTVKGMEEMANRVTSYLKSI